jgi:hypothetical protein
VAIFVSVVLYGFEALSLVLRDEESSFRLRENRRVGRTRGVGGQGLAGGALWFVLFSTHCCDIKLRRWAGHVVGIRILKN